MRRVLLLVAAAAAIVAAPFVAHVTAQAPVVKYVRFTVAGNNFPMYGILEGDNVRHIEGDLFAEKPASARAGMPTGKTFKLAGVTLLAPCTPKKVIAVGLNYKSHLGTRPVAPYPGLFAKYPTSIIGTGENIVIPADSKNIHYEGELVLVIGKTAKNVPKGSSAEYIFGVTAGNDVSERDWQSADLQWFRAKASDTFGPLGPAIVTGLNYHDLLLQTRLNGEVVQSERTKDLLFNIDTIVSYVSTYVTLERGDVIFTGTPQTTKAFTEGDTIEVEVEGVGVLRNKAVRGK